MLFVWDDDPSTFNKFYLFLFVPPGALGFLTPPAELKLQCFRLQSAVSCVSPSPGFPIAPTDDEGRKGLASRSRLHIKRNAEIIAQE
jgi:hypothetical protein